MNHEHVGGTPSEWVYMPQLYMIENDREDTPVLLSQYLFCMCKLNEGPVLNEIIPEGSQEMRVTSHELGDFTEMEWFRSQFLFQFVLKFVG